MIAKISKEFAFESAIHFEDSFIINFFNIDLQMEIHTEDHREQNIAIERVNHYINTYIENCIFVHDKDDKAIKKYEEAGLRVLILPEEPYDQIIGVILMMKFNAIMENKVVITDIIIHSKLSANIKFHTQVEESEDFLGNYWWNDPSTSYKLANQKNKKEKIVKLFDNSDWASIGLIWKDKKVDKK